MEVLLVIPFFYNNKIWPYFKENIFKTFFTINKTCSTQIVDLKIFIVNC